MSGATEIVWTLPLGGLGVMALALSAVVVTLLGGGRLGGSAALGVRIGLCAAIGVMLLGPAAREAFDRPTDGPAVEFLLDTSRSMCAPAGPGFDPAVRRIDALQASWLRSVALARAWEAGDIDIRTFDESSALTRWSQAGVAEADGDATHLARAIRDRIAAAQASGSGTRDVVVLTDGVDTPDPSGAWAPDAAGRALAAGVRLWAVVPGADEAPPDVAVEAAFDRAAAPVGESATLRVIVRHRDMEGLATTLTIRERPSPTAPWTTTARRSLTLGPTETFEIRIEPVEEGLFEYEASIEPIAGDAREDNNRAVAFLEGTDAPVRVALFENRPSWETTFFAQALREDPGVRLTSIYGLGPERERIVSPEPDAAVRGESWLMQQDIVVLGRGAERWFDAERAQMLRRFVVERGGALLLLRGNPVEEVARGAGLAQVVAEMAPVIFRRGDDTGGALMLTWAGRSRSPAAGLAAWEALPGLASVESVRRSEEKGMAEVWLRLAEGGGETALAHGRVGRGSVLVSLMDGTWRWAFSGEEAGLAAHRELWARTARWLALGGRFLPGQELRVRAATSEAQTGERVEIVVDARWFEEHRGSLRVLLSRPDGSQAPLTALRTDPARARWRASFIARQTGVHEIEARLPLLTGGEASAITRIAAAERDDEMADVAARRDLMRTLTDRTGGGLLPINEPESALAFIGQSRSSRIEWRMAPLWDEWWLFTLLTGALLAEWTWRRRRGLA